MIILFYHKEKDGRSYECRWEERMVAEPRAINKSPR
jgi:hypothetical protein